MLNKNEESAWQKASASLDVSAKVYGYRVDSVHSETFKFLGGLNRNKKDDEGKDANQDEEKENEEVKKENKVRRGQNTLETNINKLNLTKYDLDTEVDPLFSIMTSKFNESTAQGLLLNTIPLDDRLNYILESKEKKNEDQNINNNKNKEEKKNNINEEIKDIDLISEESSSDNLGKKKKDALNLAENLKENEKNPICCSNNMDLIPDEIKNVLNNFNTENNIDDFVKLKICPDLTLFRESRQLNINENNELFLKYFKDEINHAERIKSNEKNNMEGIQEEPEDIENQYDDGHMENAPDNSENGIDPNDIKDIEESSQENANLNNFTRTENVSMSLFKYDDLIEHSEKFGSGNIDILKSLPQFNSFAKAFGKIDNKGFFNKNTILGLNKKDGKKKKEEKLFEFNEENEVDINTILNDPKSKKAPKEYDYTIDYENKKKMKCFYHFDKLSTFRLYTMNNRTIFSREIEGNFNAEDQEQKILDKIEDDGNINDIGGDNNDFNNGFEGEASMVNDLQARNNNTFYQNEKEIEKNFGRLYRRFDIRNLKNKIWSNYENFYPNDNIDFRNVISNMSKEMNEDELYSISTPTCFVVMLHLCNENNMFINQKDINTFYIEKDINGEKSALSSKTKNNDITKPKYKRSKKIKKDDDEMAIDE